MNVTGHLWSILLAAGDGERLQPLTGDVDGVPVPKQFYRPDGQESMLRWAIKRAAGLVPMKRIVTVVASRHRRWWETELDDIPASNVVIQPLNRGTAAGILLPLLRVRRLDRMARVLILPTDHYVQDEGRLREAVVDAIEEVHCNHDRIVLVSTGPSENDMECGWIVPRLDAAGASVSRVAAFVEKPGQGTARRLARRGAVVNTFIMVATADAMLKLFERAVPRLVKELVACSEKLQDDLDDLYRDLPKVDFSREVLERFCEFLSVVRAADCGWIDLGTPARLGTFRGERASGMQEVVPDATARSRGSLSGVHRRLGTVQESSA